jgi:hypothetical protein
LLVISFSIVLPPFGGGERTGAFASGLPMRMR